MMRYSSASAVARVDTLLDAGTRANFGDPHPTSAVVAARGRIGGMPVWLAATDSSRARGALGVSEAEQLCGLFAAASAAPAPLLLLLDSAGARVDQGLAALGAFRRLFREALLARLAGVPMFALLGRGCFGGSSMLASLCNARLYSERTLLSVSGPAVIQALSGKDELDASDALAVQTLMGGEARARLGDSEILVEDDLNAFRTHAVALMTQDMATVLDLEAEHRRLAHRLGREALVVAGPIGEDRVQQLFPSGYTSTARGGVVVALAQDGAKPAFLGVLGGGTIGAATSWLLADELIELHASHPTRSVILLLDASGHASTRHDEQLLLSEYLSHLGLTAAWLAKQGHRVVLWILGEAAGAVYVAFAAPAEHVSALPSAQIRILPQAAVKQILRAPLSELNDTESWIRNGVADALLDSRLASYARGSRLA